MSEVSTSNLSNLNAYIVELLKTIWYSSLNYIGATEDSCNWWKSVFERKILQGKIGLNLKWFSSPSADILWEAESIVKALSKQDLASNASFEQMMDAARDDVSLNNIRPSLRSHWKLPYPHGVFKVYERRTGADVNENQGSVTNDEDIDTESEDFDSTLFDSDTHLNPLSETGYRKLLNSSMDKYKCKPSASEYLVLQNAMDKKRRSLSWPRFCQRNRTSSNKHIFLWDSASDDSAINYSNSGSLMTANPKRNATSIHLKSVANRFHTEDSDMWRFPSYEESNSINEPNPMDNGKWRFPSYEESNSINEPNPMDNGKGHSRKEANISGNRLDENMISSRQYDSEVDQTARELVDGLQRCPVENCNVQDCLLNSRSTTLSTRKNTEAFRPAVSRFIKMINDTIRKAIIIDDTPVFINKPVTKTRIVGTDISQRTRLTSFKRGATSKMTDVFEHLEALKFDVSRRRQSGPPNPIESIQRSLGLETTLLPPGPRNEFIEIDATWESGRSRLYDQQDWIISKAQNTKRKLSLSEEADTSLRNPSHDSLKYIDKEPKPNIFYLTGKAAYRYYKLLTLTESKVKLSQMTQEKEYLLKKYEWKQKTLLNLVKIARDYYSDPTEINLRRWKTLKKEISSSQDHESYTDVQMHVSSIPDYWPFFSFIIILLQFSFLMTVCFKHGVGLRGVGTRRFIRVNVPTFLGVETYSRLEEPNPWLGPPVNIFYAAGAVLAPCMRDDIRLYRLSELKGYRAMVEKNSNYFGCCERKTSLLSVAGTTTLTECINMTNELGHWTKGILCSLRNPSENSVAHIIKPCCIGYHGDCIMVSNEHCQFLNGVFHVSCDHCVQVNCLIDVCKLIPSATDIVPQSGAAWLPGEDTRWQWWRFLTAIPLTYGLVHFVAILLVEIMLMIPLETSAGWHRVMILYCCSSVAGEVIGSSIEPDLPHVGSTGGAGGILGVAVLELFQAWNFMQKPKLEALKLACIITLYLFLGTLYLFSLFSFIGGFIVGIMGCLTIVPYITFGRRLSHLRFRLVLIGFCLLLPTLISMQIFFHFIQDLKICPNCARIECVRYSSMTCQT